MLCEGGTATWVDMAAANLLPGNLYSLWLAYFDDVRACQSSACGGPDALGDHPVGTFSFVSSGVADQVGGARFSAGMLDRYLATESQVWLLLCRHGPAGETDGSVVTGQIPTPQAPSLSAPGDGGVPHSELGLCVAQAHLDVS